MSWTSTEQVIGSWLGEGAPTDPELVQIWIDRSERLLQTKVLDLATRIAADPTELNLLETAQDVVSSMVQRIFRNPSGLKTSQMSTGPFTEMVTFSGSQPGALYVTEEEIGYLTYSGTTGMAFTVDMIPTTSVFSANYVAP